MVNNVRAMLGSEWMPFIIGLLVLYVPIFIKLADEVWLSDEQGHGPIIVAVCMWLVWQRWDGLKSSAYNPAPRAGGIALIIGASFYIFGVMLEIDTLAVASLIPFACGGLLILRGTRGLYTMLFPIFFFCFAIPLPNIVVQLLTSPLKSAVSAIAEYLLYHGGYPVARSGVVLSIGHYQLLVADACAGLRSMFTLEALSLVYINLMRYDSTVRNVAIAVASMPIAFCANVIRVLLLVLITFHFGNEVGQGYMHGLAGFVLFATGLLLLLTFDAVLGRFTGNNIRRDHESARS
jgi:exosortase B